MTLVVDASVAVKWFLKDQPDEQHADLALQMLGRSVFGVLPPANPEIYLTALDLATRYPHHLFDTLYHAVALHTPNAVLITADKRYYNKARPEAQIMLLADFKRQR